MRYDTVIHNGTVVTVNPDFDIIEKGMVAISGDRIAAVGAATEGGPFEAVETVDANGGIILPGLVNTHTHLPMTLFRGLADDLPLDRWLNDHIFPAESRCLVPESVKYGTRLACIELLLGGTTTICDGYFYEDQVAAAVLEAGMRGVLGQGVIDFPAPGVPDPKQNVTAAVAFIEKWTGRSPRITPSLFCHSPYTCCTRTLEQAAAAARTHDVLFQIHVAETRLETGLIEKKHGVTPVRYLDRTGVLGPETLMAHCVWLTPEDIDTIARKGAAVSHNPESNMKLASGIAPVPDLLAAGITVGIGTDGCASNNNLDLFQEMDTTAKLHKVNRLDPTVMDARSVLEMATIEGARAIGLGRRIGSLEPGKQADIIVVDTRTPHLSPVYNPVSHLIYAAGGTDVRDVWVAGRPVVQNRRVTTLDTENIMGWINDFADSHVRI